MRAALPLIAVLVAACGGPAATPVPTAAPTATLYTLTGSMKLATASIEGSNLDCHGTGGFDDMTGGVEVVVRDQANTILATGRLGPGKKNTPGTSCTFPFTVSGIPEAPFYSVEVGRRGALTYSFADMVGAGWVVAFTLGT